MKHLISVFIVWPCFFWGEGGYLFIFIFYLIWGTTEKLSLYNYFENDWDKFCHFRVILVWNISSKLNLKISFLPVNVLSKMKWTTKVHKLSLQFYHKLLKITIFMLNMSTFTLKGHLKGFQLVSSYCYNAALASPRRHIYTVRANPSHLLHGVIQVSIFSLENIFSQICFH